MSGAQATQPRTRSMKHSPLCALEDCGRPYYAKGYCRLHWERTTRNGDPRQMVVLRGSSVAERLAHYSEPQGDCVVFTGHRDEDGYGHLTVNGADTRAHKAAFELAHGPIELGQVVRHRCDNPPCIKVEHLEPGTHADNGNDKAIRDRSTHGESNPSAKLTEAQVVEIREAIASGVKQRDIATKYGVGQSSISRIKRGTHWTRVGRTAS